jgi:carboxypeptidase C (cathepsin A)
MRRSRDSLFFPIIGLVFAVGLMAQETGRQIGRGAPPGVSAQQTGAPGGTRSGAGGGTGSLYAYDTTAAGGSANFEAKPSENHQKISLGGEILSYTTRAGYWPLRNATTLQPEAYVFYTFYAKDNVPDASARPVVFFLGGAPGVAAGWQEFGGLGPKRMRWADDGTAGLPPYTWAENPNTLLGQADLVFVNPVGTAYSRPAQPSRGSNFWNTAGDIASLGEFARGFLDASDRRNSPLFLAGEDFGTGRVAGVALYLEERQLPVAGAILLTMTMSADAVAGDAQYITLLPSLVLTAWYHKKLAPDFQAQSAAAMAETARRFAGRDYLRALYQGDRLTPEERAKVVESLARLTGLSKAFLVNNNLRVTAERFNAELLRDRRRSVSSSDARVTGFVPVSAGGRGGFGPRGGTSAVDFGQAALAGGFLTAYESYLRRELGFTNGSGIYYLQGGGIGTFASTGNDETSLAGAFARNPRLRLFVGANFFDLNAPFYATEFTVAHLSVAPEVRDRNITLSRFAAGAMAYADTASLASLQADLAKFLAEAASAARR